jgi:branched-subunit amino acid ABC-type transport system permease component
LSLQSLLATLHSTNRLPDFLTTLIAAVTLGSLYALIALGYSMVYGILKLINFAHSDVVVLGAWVTVTPVCLFVLPMLGISMTNGTPSMWASVVALVLTMLFCGVIGFAIERLAYKPIRGAPRLNALITAIAVSLLLQNIGQLQFDLINSKPSDVVTAKVASQSGTRALTIDQPFVIDTAGRFQLQFTGPTGNTQLRTLTNAPGRIDAGTTLTIDTPISKAFTANPVKVIRNSLGLKLPFGAMPGKVPALVPEPEEASRWKIDFGERGTVYINRVDVVIVITAVVLMVGLQVLVQHTKIGTAMRAVSHSHQTAALMGIPVDRVISFTFVVGAMLAAAAGFLFAAKYGQIQQPAATVWLLLGLKAFVAAVVGGIGNLRGAAVGGFLIAFVETLGPFWATKAGFANASAYQDVLVFAILILVLLVKPTGLFGSNVREKV